MLQRGVEPYGCLTDPLLDESRYVYVEASTPALLALARGRSTGRTRSRTAPSRRGGDPDLLRRVPTWFVSASDPVPASGAG